MPTKESFAEELTALITKHMESGADPQDIVDELTRESNLLFSSIAMGFLPRSTAFGKE
jgi:hypothetical protein